MAILMTQRQINTGVFAMDRVDHISAMNVAP